ncbi:MAG: hypothetical protein ACRECR_01130, partial [Thermoplasmata archaeon]
AMVLVGGVNCLGNCSGWWELRAGEWSTGSGGSPPEVYGASLAYDPARSALLLVGGVTSNGTYLAANWELSAPGGTPAWSALAAATGPSERIDAGLAWDPAVGALVLFGGEYLTEATGASAVYNDTWQLGSGGWSQLSPSSAPPARSSAALVYDAAEEVLVLFGGCGPAECPFTDLWSFGPLYAVHVSTAPADCGGAALAGLEYSDGQTAWLVNGSYPVAVIGCPEFGFLNLSASGALDFLAASGELLVQGPGVVKIEFRELLVTLFVYVIPSTCGSAVVLNGSRIGNNTTVELLPGNYSLSVAGCPGESFEQWSTEENATVVDSRSASTDIDLTGTGAVALYLTPASATPANGLYAIGWILLAFVAIGLVLTYVVVRRRARRSAQAPSTGSASPSNGTRRRPPG